MIFEESWNIKVLVLKNVFQTNWTKNINHIFSADNRTLNYAITDSSGNQSLKIYFFEDTFGDGETDSVYSGDKVLPKEGCFIATAAYGSYFEKDVKVLRDFRDHYLLTNNIGKLFVKTYYKYSPSIATFIANSEILKGMVRVILTPIVYMIKYPIYAMVLILFLFGLRIKYNKREVTV